MEITDSIKEVIKRTLEVSEVPDNISQKNCAEWDSLRHLNLVVELESEFDISFEPEEIAQMKDLTEVLKIFAVKGLS